MSKNKFAGQAVGQKPGDQVRGSEPMPRKGGRQHPFKGRLVGGAAESVLNDFKNYIAEYGALGSALGNDPGTNPQEVAAMKAQQVASRQEGLAQIADLNAQLIGLRQQAAQLNRAFPQGANPVEKAMSLRDAQAQRLDIQKQIEALMQQIASIRGQIS